MPAGVTRKPRAHWLSRNLVILTLISLLQDTASELLYPLLPLLITGLLAAPPVVLGLVEGAADATAGVTKYIAGRWSDRVGRRAFIGTGYGLAALGKVLVAAATAWPTVLVGRTVDRFGKGVRSAPRDALIAASVPPQALGRAFGFHRAGDSLGAVIGPMLALWLLAATNDDIRAALWWAVIPATASALLVLFVREQRTLPPTPARGLDVTQTGVPQPTRPRSRRRLRPAKSPLPRAFWVVTAVLVTICLLNFSDALLLLRILEVGMSQTQMILAYVAFNLVYTLAAYPAGVLTDRWSRQRTYAIGLLAFGVGYLGLGLVTGGIGAFVFIAIYGLFPAFTDSVGKAWISALVPDEHRGRAQGVFQMLTSGAVLLAGLWAGLLWATGSGSGVVPLIISGVGALGAAVLLMLRRSDGRAAAVLA